MKKAQAVSEYILVLSLVMAALIAMQVYMRRGIQGKIKDLSDVFIAPQEEHQDSINKAIPMLDFDKGIRSQSTAESSYSQEEDALSITTTNTSKSKTISRYKMEGNPENLKSHIR